MAKLSPLELIIRAIDRVTGPIDKMSQRLEKFGSKARQVGGNITTGLSVPLAGAGIASGKLSVDFQDKFTKMAGLVGVSREQLALWRDELLRLGPAVGKGPGELADAMYFITGAGFEGAKAMEILDASARAAAAGLGTTTSVADAATSAIGAYGQANLSAEQSVAILVAAVREGKAEADAFAPVIGRVTSIASSMGVSFDQVAASIAFATRMGSDASEGATQLRAILLGLARPTARANEVFKYFGLSAAGLRQELREKGLLSVLQTLKQRFGDNEAAFAAAFESSEALTGILAAVGQNGAVAEDVFRSLAQTTGKDLADAFEAAAGDPGFKLKQSLARLEAAGIRLGNVILPIVVPRIEQAALALERLSGWFGRLPEPVQSGAVYLGLFLAALGPLVVGIGSVASALGAMGFAHGKLIGVVKLVPAALALARTAFAALTAVMAANPIVAAVAAIAGLVSLGTLLYKTWKPFTDLIDGLWTDIKQIATAPGDFLERVRGVNWTGIQGGAGADFGGGEQEREPNRFAALAPQTGEAFAFGGAQRSKWDGRLQVSIDSEGQARVRKVESSGTDMKIGVDTGAVMPAW
jgi:TP901 family phage tail tape measure protein